MDMRCFGLPCYLSGDFLLNFYLGGLHLNHNKPQEMVYRRSCLDL